MTIEQSFRDILTCMPLRRRAGIRESLRYDQNLVRMVRQSWPTQLCEASCFVSRGVHRPYAWEPGALNRPSVPGSLLIALESPHCILSKQRRLRRCVNTPLSTSQVCPTNWISQCTFRVETCGEACVVYSFDLLSFYFTETEGSRCQSTCARHWWLTR